MLIILELCDSCDFFASLLLKEKNNNDLKERKLFVNSVKCIFMPIHIPKKLPDYDHYRYIIKDFTTAMTDGAI